MPEAGRPRDERLDFFRGLTMLVIFVAHMPGNSWNDFIPARFGFSSGTELFVFCSGVASALAFGRVFTQRGWLLGAARILLRIWQVYWAHVGLALVIVALVATIDARAGTAFLAQQFPRLTDDPAGALASLVTLRWLPDYLDILPMYLVILGLVPAVMALRRLHPAAPAALCLSLYALAWTHGLNLTGDPWTGAGWFLNPFGWQLVFFLGFAFGAGWLKPPAWGDKRLMLACVAFLALAAPLSFWWTLDAWPALQGVREALLTADDKSNLHPLRVVHFLAIAYVTLSLVEPVRDRLTRGVAYRLVEIGRQSLGVFLTSLVLARLGAALLEIHGGGQATIAAINLAAFALIYAVARLLAWIKSAPWSAPRSALSGTQAPAPREASAADTPTRVRELC